jgi:membrane protein required for colicin V production
MGTLDIIIAATLAGAAVFGLFRGFVRMVIGIAGLVVSMILALRFYGFGPQWFRGIIASPEMAQAAAFIAIVVVGLIASGIVAWLVRSLVQAANIGWMDRLIGMAAGVACAALMVSSSLVALTTFLPAGTSFLTESRLVPVAIGITDLVAEILPAHMARTYRERRAVLAPLAGGQSRVMPR